MTARGVAEHRYQPNRKRTTVNLHTHGCYECARSIVRRAESYSNWVEVFVDNQGDVHLNRPDKPATHPYPDAWLVGIYNGKSLPKRVAQDLEIRLCEIEEDEL